ncbi:unnamed protein product (macronuclear) [Paramecium tetraurelia]|uniref:Uncharacterized protein n=1 Tax=Paramecium tetraurelia TaxID=5888 RepID=A0DNF8_PARTE|nr:uncharacterized protein GSPATT00018771001 [Paramecium tetraurelia]CAK84575.1 unnamed protein product [Paramecium tetraurelia]|eukprot:XP_001451972.1 hypothetical protein (macronuclear) [Paramecium tetraurelia strain d4-2]
MQKQCCFDSQQTINSDEDDKIIDVLAFPTNFFQFSEASTQSLSSVESANQPISSPNYKFMGGHYSAESQEQNNVFRTFKDQKPVQTDGNLHLQIQKYPFLERQNKKLTHRNQQLPIDKLNNRDRCTQRSIYEKQGDKYQAQQKMSLTPRQKKQNEKQFMPSKLNGILKVSCLKTRPNETSKIRPIFDLLIGRPSNKNVSFVFTMEQIKTMRINNKSNIFNMPMEKNTKLFLV